MKRFFTILLSLFVLTSTIGMPLSKRTCYSKGETEVSLSIEDHCCPSTGKALDGQLRLDSCCDFEVTYYQHDYEVSTSTVSSIFDFELRTEPIEVPIINIKNHLNISEFEGRGPPVNTAGKVFLSLIQSFLL